MAAGRTPPDEKASSGAAARGRLVALAVLLGVGAVLVAVALLAGGSGESDGDRSSLRVERSPTPEGVELLVFVEARHNRAERAGGASQVSVECEDDMGRVVAQGNYPWPFTDTDAGTTEAHVHQPVPDAAASAVTLCRLSGTDPELQGRITDGSLR